MKKRLTDILEQIFDFYLAGEGPVGKSLHSDPIFGAPLAHGLKELVTGHECFALWRLLGPMFEWNMDEVLWMFMHITADVWTWERRTEWRYLHGPGATGKDTLYLLISVFLGEHATGGHSTIFTPAYFIGRQKKGDLDTILDTAKNMRVVLCNEVPDHDFFDHDRLKPLVEQRGAGLLSRTIYEKPEKWLPMCGVQFLSNHPMKATPKQGQDTGARRRANVLKLTHVFEENASKDVKANVGSGAYNPELFWLSRLMMTYLRRCPAGFTRIHPRPPRVMLVYPTTPSRTLWRIALTLRPTPTMQMGR
jgi:hypothetical protein